MKNKLNFRSFLPHLLVIIGFAILSVGYMSPILNGKILIQSDPRSFYAAQTELRNFTKETGEWTGWTNSMFGGMPTYFIGGNYSKSVFFQIQQVLYNLFSVFGTYIFLYLIGAYILLRSLKVSLWPSIIGAIGYAFFSYNILIIEAGHAAKVYALAFVPIMLAGLVLAFRGKPWLGVALFGLGVGLEINANHFQITYYSAFVILIFGIFELVRAIKEQKTTSFIIAAVSCIVFGLLATATNTARIWTTIDHTKETNRGGSELVKEGVAASSKGGLDKDYAYAWSYGKLETFTLLIPNFSGGSSGGEHLGKDSETYKTLTRLGVDANTAEQFSNNLPTYWGDQTFVGGTTYAGAIICFLFVLGLFFADKRYRLPFLVSGIFCLTISWGGNFRILNDLWFDYLPMFNKFRAVSMILSIVQLCMIIIAGLGLGKILKNPPSWNEFKKPFFISLAATAGISLLFALIPSVFNMTNAADENLQASLRQSFGNNATAANEVYQALVEDRAGLLRKDAFRSLFFILLVAGILWAYITQKLKNTTIVGASIALLTLIDLWAVDKRYLNDGDFQRKPRSYDDFFVATAADQQILQDKSLDYRIIDLTSGNPFSNSMASFFHKSIGGYHTVKLTRYAELIENQIAKNNMQVLNMLNTKYFITQGADGQPIAQQNPGALGNAWFVSDIKMVNNANEEMAALDSLNPATTAVVDKRFSDYLKDFSPSKEKAGSIQLTDYKPNKLTYQFDSPSAQLVVFSENYYKGNIDWVSTIDGKETPHFRADYVLRSMVVPAGKHTIVFTFKPVTVEKGQKIDWLTSIVWVVLTLVAIAIGVRKKEETAE